MVGSVHRFVFDQPTGWEGAQIVAISPVVGRADGAGRKASATVGTDIVENVVDAICAKRALETADAGQRRIWRELNVAVFARGPKGERLDNIKVFFGDPIFAAYFFFGYRH